MSDYSVHTTAIVDEGAKIGAGTRIWHWVHVSAGARIGRDCSLGQNVYVGNRVKHRRMALSMSQEQLGVALGVTFQQVQKYERGANRIGASRLWDLSRVLECPVSYFYDDMDEETASNSPRKLGEHFRRAERGPAS